MDLTSWTKIWWNAIRQFACLTANQHYLILCQNSDHMVRFGYVSLVTYANQKAVVEEQATTMTCNVY